MKCHRWGWSLRHCLTRKRARLELLLLVAALAIVVQQVVGMAAEARGLARRHQANTIRKRRVLSIYLLGGLVLNGDDGALLRPNAIMAAVAKLRRDLQRLAGG